MDLSTAFAEIGPKVVGALASMVKSFAGKKESAAERTTEHHAQGKTTGSITGDISGSKVAIGDHIDQSTTQIQHYHAPGSVRINRILLGVLVVCFLIGFAYGPLWEKYQERFASIPFDENYILSSGVFSKFAESGDGKDLKQAGDEPDTYMWVNGSMLTKYKSGKKLIGVCFHLWNSDDFRDVNFISTSAPYDIKPGTIQMTIRLHRMFLEEETIFPGAPRLPTKVRYVLLAVPSKVGPGDFKTIREAEKLGADVISQTDRNEVHNISSIDGKTAWVSIVGTTPL